MPSKKSFLILGAVVACLAVTPYATSATLDKYGVPKNNLHSADNSWIKKPKPEEAPSQTKPAVKAPKPTQQLKTKTTNSTPPKASPDKQDLLAKRKANLERRRERGQL